LKDDLLDDFDVYARKEATGIASEEDKENADGDEQTKGVKDDEKKASTDLDDVD